jgi:hypothetical protein
MKETERAVTKARMKCIRKFNYYFKGGFKDTKYFEWERSYKLEAHSEFNDQLNEEKFRDLLNKRKYSQIAQTAARVESRTNLLFSFEKMAFRDAIKTSAGAKSFATGLFDYLYEKSPLQERFEKFAEVISSLPRKQTRVFTWPLMTVFGFIGNPKEHIFLKPRVTQKAAEKYKFDFEYNSKPDFKTYRSLLLFAAQIKKDTRTMSPKDYIDLQSFIWVMGSDEYPD